MLKKKERLTKAEFDRSFSVGRRYHTPLLTMIYTKHPTFHSAAVVGKKVSKKAVVRNKLRRRAYNALYSIKQEGSLTGIYIVLMKPTALKSTHSELKETLTQVVGRISKTG